MINLKKLSKLLLSLLIILWCPINTSAGTATANLTISATVAAACAVTGNALPFGTYTGSQVDISATITVLCTFGLPYSISLDKGKGTSASVTARKMTSTTSSSDTLAYSLAKDAAQANNWGTGTTGEYTGTGGLDSYTVYARIAGGLTPKAGVYTDTVEISISY